MLLTFLGKSRMTRNKRADIDRAFTKEEKKKKPTAAAGSESDSENHASSDSQFLRLSPTAGMNTR